LHFVPRYRILAPDSAIRNHGHGEKTQRHENALAIYAYKINAERRHMGVTCVIKVHERQYEAEPAAVYCSRHIECCESSACGSPSPRVRRSSPNPKYAVAVCSTHASTLHSSPPLSNSRRVLHFHLFLQGQSHFHLVSVCPQNLLGILTIPALTSN
jgi:hypothetical protein